MAKHSNAFENDTVEVEVSFEVTYHPGGWHEPPSMSVDVHEVEGSVWSEATKSWTDYTEEALRAKYGDDKVNDWIDEVLEDARR